jgi:hypothetical protein
MHKLITLSVSAVQNRETKVLQPEEVAVLRASGDVHLQHVVKKRKRKSVETSNKQSCTKRCFHLHHLVAQQRGDDDGVPGV